MKLLVVGMAIASALAFGNAPAGAAPLSSTIEPAIDCHTAARPVIVLPGADGTTAETADQWAVMTAALRRMGACPLLFQGGVVNGARWAGDMATSARQLAAFVAEVRNITGAPKVDIVAHSAGSFVANYYLKVLHGAPEVRSVVFLAPEVRDCDGAGFYTAYGIPNLPITPVQALQAMPWLAPVLIALVPSMANAVEMSPVSATYHAVMDGPLAQPGVRYSVLATEHDELATPAGVCSFIDEPGVTNVFLEDVYPQRPAVDHSTLRASPDAADWVVRQLTS